MFSSASVARVQVTKCWILCPIAGTRSSTAHFSTTISTKAVSPKLMSDNLYTYLVNHTRESDTLTDLRYHTNTTVPNAARMAVSPEQGAFLSWLIKSLDVKKIIEVGVFMGYSSIAMASALPDPGGQLYALDRDPVAMETAKQYWVKAGVDHLIKHYVGSAVDSLKSIIESGEKEQFDFAFIDADKRGYDGYYESILQLVKPGGVIVIDNVLWYGRVADDEEQDKTTIALRDLNNKLLMDGRIDFSLIPVGDGMAMCRKR